jgi:Domain of unknown function (DUF1848)
MSHREKEVVFRMIISASYKTDIPTFYGDWFLNRLRAGYCKTLNPYNLRINRVSLRPEDVDGFVFWTKNIGPFLKHLPKVQATQVPFVIQHTINGYPRTLEQSVVHPEKAVSNLLRVAETYGQRVCVWRYDTVVLSSLTPREFHEDSFSKLAKELEGATDEVVVSFAHIYKKTRRNMDHSARELGFEWTDPDEVWKRELLARFVDIARTHHMSVCVCSQPQFLVPGSSEARCIDSHRLQALAGRSIPAREKGNRPDCRCSEAKDIGEYDTCPHGCVYCYAVQNRQLAVRRFREHNPESELLFPPPGGATEGIVAADQGPTLFDTLQD